MTRPAVALLAFLGAAAPAGAQWRTTGAPPIAGPTWRAGASVTSQSRFLGDASGVSVEARPTLALEGGVTVPVVVSERFGLRYRVALHLRASMVPLRIVERSDSIGPSRPGGRSALADLSLRIQPELDGLLELYAAVGAVYLRGPRDLAPFRFRGVNGPHESAEMGLAVRVARRPIYLTAAAQLFGLPSDPAGNLQGGPVGRWLVGLRHGH